MKNIKHHSNDPPKPKRQWQHITWTAKSYYIDHDTGELLTKQIIKNEKYYKLFTEKHYEISQTQPKGTIYYTIHYRRNPQTTLF